jgi:hypothetical protein
MVLIFFLYQLQSIRLFYPYLVCDDGYAKPAIKLKSIKLLNLYLVFDDGYAKPAFSFVILLDP